MPVQPLQLAVPFDADTIQPFWIPEKELAGTEVANEFIRVVGNLPNASVISIGVKSVRIYRLFGSSGQSVRADERGGVGDLLGPAGDLAHR